MKDDIEHTLMCLANYAELQQQEQLAVDVLITHMMDSERHTNKKQREPSNICKLVDPIVKLKAQHTLSYKRQLLARNIAFSITLEELKLKFALKEDDHQIQTITETKIKYRMNSLTKRFDKLYILQPTALKPSAFSLSTRSMKELAKTPKVLPFKPRRNRQNLPCCSIQSRPTRI